MGAFSRFGRARRLAVRRHVRVLEEGIAALDEDLTFTLAFAAKMIDDGDFGAAAGVLEEGRTTLRKGERGLLEGLRTGAALRRAAAMGGLAAAIISSSLVVAAVRHGEASAPVERLQRASEQLETVEVSDSAGIRVALAGVGDVLQSLPDGAATGQIRSGLLRIRGQVLGLLLPELRKDLRVSVRSIANSIDAAVRASAPSAVPSTPGP